MFMILKRNLYNFMIFEEKSYIISKLSIIE